MGDVIVGFAVDESGSMNNCVKDTLRGFNKLVEEQAQQPGNAYITLVLFSDAPVTRINGGDMKLVDPLGTGANKYNPAGMTALYDGATRTIREVEDWLASNQGFSGDVLIVILTDGGENASTQASLHDLNRLIADKRENHGWEFVFIGSGGAAWTEGEKLTSVPAYGSVSVVDNSSIGATYAGVSNTLTNYRSGASPSFAAAMVDTFGTGHASPKTPKPKTPKPSPAPDEATQGTD